MTDHSKPSRDNRVHTPTRTSGNTPATAGEDMEPLPPMATRRKCRRRSTAESALDATLRCPKCGFTAPPGTEHLRRDIGQDTLVGLKVGPKVNVSCPICGHGFRRLDPDLVSVRYTPAETIPASDDED
jgi:predicted RNA-binding Zn-ribbon protein involved in translation (DUF1610 family)